MSSPKAKMSAIAPRMRVEVAFEVVAQTSVVVLRRFREPAGTLPDLRLSTDVEALGPLLDVRGVLRLYLGMAVIVYWVSLMLMETYDANDSWRLLHVLVIIEFVAVLLYKVFQEFNRAR